jgi:hypothetical protein
MARVIQMTNSLKFFVGVLLVGAIVFWITFKRTDKPQNEALTLGWSELVSCSDLMSLDGSAPRRRESSVEEDSTQRVVD